jgi:hypothetical protein
MAKKVSKEQYDTLKVLLENGHIKTFNQIFDATGIKRTNLAADMGLHYQTFVYRLKYPASFTYRESYIIANLVGVDKNTISALINAQSDSNKKPVTKAKG